MLTQEEEKAIAAKVEAMRPFMETSAACWWTVKVERHFEAAREALQTSATIYVYANSYDDAVKSAMMTLREPSQYSVKSVVSGC